MVLTRPAILSLLVIAVVFCQSAFSAESNREAKGKKTQKLEWQNNYSQTLKLARSQKKWVLIDVSAEWCKYCKIMDAEVYSNPKIIQFLNKSFVCMKADADRGEGKMIAQKFGVNELPCALILKSDGKEKGRVAGYYPVSRFPIEISNVIVKGQ